MSSVFPMQESGLSQPGALKTCEWLLAHGASLDKKDINGDSALLLAAQEGGWTWMSHESCRVYHDVPVIQHGWKILHKLGF